MSQIEQKVLQLGQRHKNPKGKHSALQQMRFPEL